MITKATLFIITTSLLFLSFLLSLSKGSTSLSLYQLFFDHHSEIQTILWQFRLPRTIEALTAGALLALAGSLMQLLLQNPLADPYALGTSGGAAFFTLLLMLSGASANMTLGGAWLGSAFAVLLVLSLARKHWAKPHTLLLSGIITASAFAALISFTLLMSPERNLPSMLFWLTGDLTDAHYPWTALGILAFGSFICYWLAPGLNLLLLGTQQAKMLGINPHFYQAVLFVLTSLFTAAAVTIAGCVGFIGLIIPNFTRHLIGHDHKITLPISMMLGASLLTFADTLARSLLPPQQLPVGILMSLIGLPIFAWLLQK